MTRAWLLLLVGCGGSPFALVDTVIDVTPAPDAAPMLDGGRAALAPDAAAVDAGDRHDAPAEGSALDVSPDAGADVAPPPAEAGPDVAPEATAPDAATPDAAPVCTPVAPSIQYCGQSAAQLIPPGQFCRTTYNGPDFAVMMPLACQCRETYTCACLEAHGPPCPAGQAEVCALDNGGTVVHVTCK